MFPSGALPMPRLEHATPEQLSVEKKNNENLLQKTYWENLKHMKEEKNRIICRAN